jgi:cytochrome c-type biogenesis protein CcmE
MPHPGYYSPRPPASNAMTLRQRRRFLFVLSLFIAGAGAAALALFALQDNVLYFYSPSDVYAKHVAPGVAFRIGGLVAKKSVHKGPGPLVRFVVSDGKASIPVTFRGDLPALFGEGGGVVAIGSLAPSGTFEANQVLAKHDEKYMPPEVVDALKRSGRWQETGPQTQR